MKTWENISGNKGYSRKRLRDIEQGKDVTMSGSKRNR